MSALLPVIAPIVENITGSLFPDPKEARKRENDVLKAVLNVDLAQIATNTEEAKSSSLFIAGWRPCLGWICALALFYSVILTPFLTWFSDLFSLPKPPDVSLNEIMELLVILCGIVGLRTFEKWKGFNTHNITGRNITGRPTRAFDIDMSTHLRKGFKGK